MLATFMLLLPGCRKSPDGAPSATAASAPAFDARMFDGVYNAGQAMKNATDVGVAEARYRELLHTLDDEVASARSRAKTDKERQLAATYGDALNTYTDALAVWDAQSSDFQRTLRDVHGNEHDVLYVDDHNPELIALVSRYKVPTIPLNNMPTVDANRVLRTIFTAANDRLDHANAMRNGN